MKGACYKSGSCAENNRCVHSFLMDMNSNKTTYSACVQVASCIGDPHGDKNQFSPKGRPEALTIGLKDWTGIVRVSKIVVVENLGLEKTSGGNQRRVYITCTNVSKWKQQTSCR